LINRDGDCLDVMEAMAFTRCSLPQFQSTQWHHAPQSGRGLLAIRAAFESAAARPANQQTGGATTIAPKRKTSGRAFPEVSEV